jgi:DNA-binding XRE family transcriptional regulator
MAVLQRLREIRLEQALSQRALATKADVTQATIVKAEAGADVRPSTHRKLADALGVQPRELVGERS